MAVAYRGRVVYEAGFGLADLSTHAPVDAHTRFAIGSLTKQLTAAAIELLVEEKKISLGDPLAKYEPSLPNAQRITLNMLLDQTSGLHNYPKITEHEWPLSGPIAVSRIIAILSTDKPDFEPGARWAYSNANYTALAGVLGKAASMQLGEFLAMRVFAPLRMTDSGFGYAAQSRAVAVGYANGTPEEPPLSLDLFSGAGAAVSSAHDLALWDVALLHGALFPGSYVDRIAQQSAPTGQGSQRYGMGWVITELAGHAELWHNGLAPGVGGYCYNALFPSDDLAIVVLTNGFGADGLPERMTETIAAAYGIGTAPSPAPLTSGDSPAIDALARTFWNQLASNSVDRSKLTAEFAAALTPDLLAQVRQGIEAFGDLRSFAFLGTRQEDGLTGYRYALTFSSGVRHEWDVWIDQNGKIAGSRLVQ
jgi:D-alanyl-D-alanine carboxypeptidase